MKYEEMSVAALKALAKERSLAGVSGLKKADLIKRLVEAEPKAENKRPERKTEQKKEHNVPHNRKEAVGKKRPEKEAQEEKLQRKGKR